MSGLKVDEAEMVVILGPSPMRRVSFGSIQGLEMAIVPAGSSTMFDSPDVDDRADQGFPSVEVHVSEPIPRESIMTPFEFLGL
jgi:hypothetical protein